MGKGSFKKVVSFLLSLIMTLSICLTAVPSEVKAATGGTLTISAEAAHGIDQLHRGDTVTITAALSGNAEANGVSFKFQYDPNMLELQNAPERGDAYSGADSSDLQAVNAGTIGVVIAKNEGIINGKVFTAKFLVKDNVKGNISTQITGVDFTKTEVVDGSYIYDSVDCDEVNNAGNMKVIVPATKVTLDQTTITIAKDDTRKLTATLTPSDADSTVVWTSSNEAVAKVGQDGTVTAVGKGTAVITAASGETSASCTVNVTLPLKSITISGTASTLKKGTTATLTVSYDPADTTDNKTVVWSSSDPGKATVKSTGTNTAIVEALADGSVTITATVGSKSATYTINVKEVKLERIEIKSAATIHRGEEEVLQVTYVPEDTTDDKTVIWSSSDPDIVSVDGSGKVKAIAVGGANITAKVGNAQAVCAVTVDAPLKAIIPTETKMNLVKKQTGTITYTLNPEDTTDSKDVTFSSDNVNVATVNPSSGEVTAVAEGTATVTLTGANGVKATVTVTVTEIPINSVIIDRTNAIMEKNGTVDLKATVGPSDTTDDDKTIKWESSDSSVVTVAPAVSNSGQAVTITATDKGGTATITATAGKGMKATCEITVLIHIESISTPASVTMSRKSTQILDVTYDPENTTDDKTVTWSSDNEEVATVDPQTGTITAIKEGTANITATTKVNSSVTGAPAVSTTEVKVVEKHLTSDIGDQIAFIKGEPILKNQSLNMNNRLNLEEIKENYGITDDITILWSSSDEAVAVIDQTGQVVGQKEGTATITAVIRATDGEGNEVGEYTVTTELEINEIPLDAIAFNKVITRMQVGATETLGIIYNPENTTDLKDVSWSSSDPNIISVKDGKLTALKAGKATITAKVGDKTVSCEITVVDTASDKKGQSSTSTGNRRPTSPETGDPANIALYAVLMLMSLAVAIGTILIAKYSHRARR